MQETGTCSTRSAPSRRGRQGGLIEPNARFMNDLDPLFVLGGWSAKLEYLYLDLGNRSTAMAFAALPAIVDDARLTMNVVRAGINYRF